MKQIVIATTNPGKRKEIVSALGPFEGTEFLSLSDLSQHHPDAEETGASYAENALLKAQHYFKLIGLPIIAEDSGIEVNALRDELGVHTRRWGAGSDVSDQEWIDYFMQKMASEEDRRARFVSHCVYIDETGHTAFEGECRGIITAHIESEIEQGIPLSAVFRPEGYDKVYSAMTAEEKNAISHRGWSVKKLREWMST
ncbi:MAG: non-canonical purine NTP pyrophosphatase [Candidatus Gracilibacteria bacterium]|nr:non-canonical purine NTP pyrophosphatase [Candidatus Gracilibacteria bacterium]